MTQFQARIAIRSVLHEPVDLRVISYIGLQIAWQMGTLQTRIWIRFGSFVTGSDCAVESELLQHTTKHT